MAELTELTLHPRVERYEAAVAELRVCHEDVRAVLARPVLYEHWRMLGAALGFEAAPLDPDGGRQQSVRDLVSVGDLNRAQQWES
jgi:hypothetical protein